jgi:predicted  nucleic acid-binding Zn-ribbon protein
MNNLSYGEQKIVKNARDIGATVEGLVDIIAGLDSELSEAQEKIVQLEAALEDAREALENALADE